MSLASLFFDGLATVLVAATLPLLADLLPLSVAALLPTRQRRPTSAMGFRLAVIVPAHNEERLIAACVESILASAQHGSNGSEGDVCQATLYVVAHNCTDRTAELASRAGASVLPLNDAAGGKGNALHFGFTEALARGAQGVLVVDADSSISPNLCHAVSSRLLAGAGAVQCRYLVANAEQTARTRLMHLALLGMNLVRPRGRARLGLSCGIFGNGFALSAATLNAVPYLANSVVEDLEYHLHLLRAGIRVHFLDEATVLGEMPDSNAAASTQRARWEGGRMLMRRTWRGPLAREVFSGRLLMLEPLLDLLALPLASEAVLLLLGLLLPLAWIRLYAVSGLLVLMLYVLASALLAPSPGSALRALASAPGYVLWKLAMLPRTRLAARRDAAWVRTERNRSAP